MLDKENLQK
ncbi:hypothetical protein CP8484711_0334A, partial [Chlamydia psittaci 84-8471/1]